jgi:hypothetical protein
MNPSTPTTAPAYVLSEDSYLSLLELSNQMFLMASVIFAKTKEEENTLLRLPRSQLGECLQGFANQLAQALESTQTAVRMTVRTQRTH